MKRPYHPGPETLRDEQEDEVSMPRPLLFSLIAVSDAKSGHRSLSQGTERASERACATKAGRDHASSPACNELPERDTGHGDVESLPTAEGNQEDSSAAEARPALGPHAEVLRIRGSCVPHRSLAASSR